MQEWENFYVNLFQRDTRSSTQFYDCIHPHFDSIITLRELQTGLHKCKSGKAAGSDGLNNDFYKHLTPNWQQTALNLFNSILASETIPKS